MDYDQLVDAMQEIAEGRGHWGGYPLPIEEHPLSLCKQFPFQGLNGMKLDEEDEEYDQPDFEEVVNQWFSLRRRSDVYVVKNMLTGKSSSLEVFRSLNTRLDNLIKSVAPTKVWSIGAELRAMATLQSIVTQNAFRQYVMTGVFLETSERSNVTYLFRRLAPTIALSRNSKHGGMRILCSLCLHPIGYYKDTHAGCMVPTDDVIAHVTMMRGDERGFWSKANQHSTTSKNFGL